MFGAVPAGAQDFPSRYRVETWDERQGLPSGRVWSIAQDGDGYLWLGSEAGLMRFDGVRFVRWTAVDGTPLPEESIVFSMHGARDGSLWLGFQSGGIGRIRDGRLDLFQATPAFSDGPLQFILEDSRGTLWAGDPDGVYRFEAPRWTRIGGTMGLPDTGGFSAHEDSDGALWVSTSAGIFVRPAGGDTFRPVDVVRREVRFADNGHGRVWLTDPAHGFARQVGSTITSGTQQASGQSIVSDRRGTVWLGTGGEGLWQLADSTGTAPRIQRITTADGLSSDVVRSTYVDNDGNLWVGTDSGLNRIAERKIQPMDGLPYSFAIATTPDGSVWLASNEGLVQIDGDLRRRFGPADGLPSGSIRALFTDVHGTLWVATTAGFARRSGSRFVPLAVSGPPLSRLIAVAADSRGTLWVCDRIRGAFVVRNGTLTPIADTPVTGPANFVYVDRRDQAWIGYAPDRIIRLLPDGSRTSFTLSTPIGAAFTAVHEDPEGGIWVGGTRGLARVATDRVDAIVEPSPLPGYGVFAIAQDEAGDLWLGLNSGMLRLPVREFERAARMPRPRISYAYYDASDGLVGVPTRRGFPGAVRTSNGSLWFITSRGASVVTPREIVDGAPQAMVRIERVNADDQPLPLTAGATLPAGTSRLLFEYTAVNLSAAMKDRFVYRLQGIDTDWVDAGARREAFYPNLRSGRYRFEVARSDAAADSGRVAAWDFAIAPMFYETWWFMASCAAAVGAAGWAAWALRLRTLRRQFAVVFGERARMGRELHDTLLQTLVAISLHFDELAVALGHANAAAAEQVQWLRRHLELAVVEARQLVWDLRSGTLAESGLAQVIRESGERIFEGRDARFTMSVVGTPVRCAREIEQHLLRIAQEALRNAARYADAATVRLLLEYHGGGITLEVHDDGRGLPRREEFGETLDHFGFRIMHERAQQIGAAFHVESSPGQGTRISVQVPLAHVSPS